jgi:hypothetical protein
MPVVFFVDPAFGSPLRTGTNVPGVLKSHTRGLGGVTYDLLARMRLPIFMSH